MCIGVVGCVMIGIGSCLSEATQQPVEAYAVVDKAVQVGDVDACLSHGVALAQGDGIVFERLMVDGDAEGRAYGILATVALAYGVFFVVMCGEVEFEVVDNFACFFGQSVFADQRHYGAFDGCQRLGQVEHYASLAVFEGLFFVGRT